MVSETTSISATDKDSPSESLDESLLSIEWSGREESPGVVLLHGWGSSAELMRPIARALSDKFRIANVDLPGHGKAAAPPRPIGVPEHAQLVCDLIRRRFGKAVAIVGHSNGGRIALYVASDLDTAQLVDKLVLISPSGIRPKRKAGYYFKKYLAKALKAPFEILPTRLRELGLDWLRHTLLWHLLGSSDYRRLTGVMRDTFVKTVTHHLDDRVHHIQAPTLIFWGDQDEDIKRQQIAVLEEKIPDAGLVVMAGAGHYGYLDDPVTFLRATRHFLEENRTG